MKQCQRLESVSDFQFKSGNRLVRIRTGQQFWVTNTESDQHQTKTALIEREGKGHISAGWPFTLSDVETYFRKIP